MPTKAKPKNKPKKATPKKPGKMVELCYFCKEDKPLKVFTRVIVFYGINADAHTERVRACASCRKENQARYDACKRALTTPTKWTKLRAKREREIENYNKRKKAEKSGGKNATSKRASVGKRGRKAKRV